MAELGGANLDTPLPSTSLSSTLGREGGDKEISGMKGLVITTTIMTKGCNYNGISNNNSDNMNIMTKKLPSSDNIKHNNESESTASTSRRTMNNIGDMNQLIINTNHGRGEGSIGGDGDLWCEDEH